MQNSNVGRWHVFKTRFFCQISAFALTILDGDERRTLRGRYARIGPEEHLKGPSINTYGWRSSVHRHCNRWVGASTRRARWRLSSMVHGSGSELRQGLLYQPAAWARGRPVDAAPCSRWEMLRKKGGCMAGRMQACTRGAAGAAGAAWQVGVRDVRLQLACAVLAVGSNPV